MTEQLGDYDCRLSNIVRVTSLLIVEMYGFITLVTLQKDLNIIYNKRELLFTFTKPPPHKSAHFLRY